MCILLDTEAVHTLVREGLVAPEDVWKSESLRVGCCHGDWREYPTAQVKIEVGNKVLLLKAGVVPGLPRDVLLGADVEDLPAQTAMVREVRVNTVTRALAKHQNQEDAAVRAKCAASGATPRELVEAKGKGTSS